MVRLYALLVRTHLYDSLIRQLHIRTGWHLLNKFHLHFNCERFDPACLCNKNSRRCAVEKLSKSMKIEILTFATYFH